MREKVYLNNIVTALPPYEVHSKFLGYVPSMLTDERERRLFSRLASKAQIETRYSVIEPAPDAERLDARGFYRRGAFPTSSARMAYYKDSALPIATRAVRQILEGVDATSITHMIVTSCTGFYAPGLDLELQREFRLRSNLERSIIGFMGCYAAFNGMKAAYHAVRSQPDAKVLLINLELCTLHLHENFTLEQLLAFMQFADGCAASLISSEPTGIELKQFHTDVAADARDLITWHIGDQGFDMHLSPSVPQALGQHVPGMIERWLGAGVGDVNLWAVHPGGRSILDAVQDKLHLTNDAMASSREVLRKHGNMSSATIMFVLKSILEDPTQHGEGVAMAFGPGLTMEAMRFSKMSPTTL